MMNAVLHLDSSKLIKIFFSPALSDQSAPGRVLFSGNFFFNNALAGDIFLIDFILSNKLQYPVIISQFFKNTIWSSAAITIFPSRRSLENQKLYR